MNNPYALVLTTKGGNRDGVIFPEKIVARVAKHEKRARKFSKPTNTNEEVVSQEGKGYLY
jgi:hypothetical protein